MCFASASPGIPFPIIDRISMDRRKKPDMLEGVPKGLMMKKERYHDEAIE